jgi:hypothetical protein
MTKKTPTQRDVNKDYKTIQSTLRQMAKIARSQGNVMLADNLTNGALDGIDEQKFVPVNLSELLQYIADLM